jgi:hypothetical protein
LGQQFGNEAVPDFLNARGDVEETKRRRSKVMMLPNMKKTMKMNGKKKKMMMKVLVNVQTKMNMKKSIEANIMMSMNMKMKMSMNMNMKANMNINATTHVKKNVDCWCGNERSQRRRDTGQLRRRTPDVVVLWQQSDYQVCGSAQVHIG